jgi:hypothetical protein
MKGTNLTEQQSFRREDATDPTILDPECTLAIINSHFGKQITTLAY